MHRRSQTLALLATIALAWGGRSASASTAVLIDPAGDATGTGTPAALPVSDDSLDIIGVDVAQDGEALVIRLETASGSAGLPSASRSWDASFVHGDLRIGVQADSRSSDCVVYALGRSETATSEDIETAATFAACDREGSALSFRPTLQAIDSLVSKLRPGSSGPGAGDVLGGWRAATGRRLVTSGSAGGVKMAVDEGSGGGTFTVE